MPHAWCRVYSTFLTSLSFSYSSSTFGAVVVNITYPAVFPDRVAAFEFSGTSFELYFVEMATFVVDSSRGAHVVGHADGVGE